MVLGYSVTTVTSLDRIAFRTFCDIHHHANQIILVNKEMTSCEIVRVATCLNKKFTSDISPEAIWMAIHPDKIQCQ